MCTKITYESTEREKSVVSDIDLWDVTLCHCLVSKHQEPNIQ